MSIVVHVTHEAIQKMGGIGAVLEGLLTTHTYNAAIERTFLVGPLFPGADLGGLDTILYRASEGITDTPHAKAISEIEQTYHVEIVYGQRRFADKDKAVTTLTDVILVNVSSSNEALAAQFKWQLYEHFQIESNRYENEWEFEEYVRLAEPAYAALRAIIGPETTAPVFVISHEFMGMPLALKVLIERKHNEKAQQIRTVFYAHEVATVRPIVEGHPGHDVRFYNALAQAKAGGAVHPRCVRRPVLVFQARLD